LKLKKKRQQCKLTDHLILGLPLVISWVLLFKKSRMKQLMRNLLQRKKAAATEGDAAEADAEEKPAKKKAAPKKAAAEKQADDAEDEA